MKASCNSRHSSTWKCNLHIISSAL